MSTREALLAAKATLGARFLQARARSASAPVLGALTVESAVASAGQNVHAVGIGKKVVEGSETPTVCVRVYVVQKLPESFLPPIYRIPETIDGIPTDVIQSPPASLLAKKEKLSDALKEKKIKPPPAVPACSTNRQQRQRPIPAGISAGHFMITAGTLGCFCRSTKPGDDPDVVYALSNNHVFANVNKGAAGDELRQPGPLDSGGVSDAFATLARWVPIQLGGTLTNRVDAAIGRLAAGVAHKQAICSIGQVNGTTQATEDMIVRKHGRTSGLTEGRVTDVSYDALVGMDHNDPSVVAQFNDQMRIERVDPFPAIGLGGDSGSLVVDKEGTRAVGLYFAGPPDGSYGVANQVADVLALLEIALL